jgi:competence protein ComEC
MSNRKTLYLLIIFLLTVCFILAGIIVHSQKQDLSVDFLDVGQGDAILISEGSKQILIDGGPNGQVLLEKLGKYIPFWDRNIEIIIATHPDQDHIDGLIDVMKAYNIGEIIDNSEEADSQVYKKYKETIGANNIPRIKGQSGMKIKINENTVLEILSPGETLDNNSKESNSDSIVSKLTYGENTFLFTGDLTEEKERELIGKNIDLKSNFIKIAHHGSKYATSIEFLEKVSPKEAIISVGKNNRYGHPSSEVLDRLKSEGINILRTDEKKDILYICNMTSKCKTEE